MLLYIFIYNLYVTTLLFPCIINSGFFFFWHWDLIPCIAIDFSPWETDIPWNRVTQMATSKVSGISLLFINWNLSLATFLYNFHFFFLTSQNIANYWLKLVVQPYYIVIRQILVQMFTSPSSDCHEESKMLIIESWYIIKMDI